jgi:hypothetical protein
MDIEQQLRESNHTRASYLEARTPERVQALLDWSREHVEHYIETEIARVHQLVATDMPIGASCVLASADDAREALAALELREIALPGARQSLDASQVCELSAGQLLR